MIEKKKMTNYQIKAAFEYFNDLYAKPGKSVTYSRFIYNNREILVKPYLAMQNLIYDEGRDPEFTAFNQQVNDLRTQFALIENGKPVVDEKGNPKLADPDIFFAELEKLKTEKFKDLITRINNKGRTNDAVLNQVVELDVEVLTASEFIPDAPPFIVGQFIYGIN